jgi:hypothetical protein
MAKKTTPELPGDMFNDDHSAISRLTGGGTGKAPGNATIAEPQSVPSVADPAKKEAQNRSLKQTSFYLSPEQLLKLDDLAHNHYRRTGKRINRNDIVRHLVDRCQLNDIADLE